MAATMATSARLNAAATPTRPTMAHQQQQPTTTIAIIILIMNNSASYKIMKQNINSTARRNFVQECNKWRIFAIGSLI